MTIFVTGGAGFIGSNFIFHMLKEHPDYRIVCLDKLTYAGNLSTLAPVMDNPNFRFVKESISDRKAVYDLFEAEHPDLVINFAAESHVDRSIENPSIFLETNVMGLHPELIKLIGRMKYRTSYGQNVLNHSIEVSHIAGLLASELGVDVATAKRAGLLHDIGKAIDHEVEGSHVTIGVNIARKYKESEEVIHAIEAHHGDVEAHTVVACLVQAADAISAARPGARRENIENYVKRLEKLEEVTKSFPGIANCFAIQAGREIRIMVKPEEVSEDQMVLLARDIAKKIEDELTYPGQIKVNLLRETKAIDYAK